MQYTVAELAEIIAKHKKWVLHEDGGERADLQGADLHGAYLQGADLHGAYLRGAYLRGAYLRGADLRGADLHGAYLQGADLQGAYLRGADLRGADLHGAYLRGADLQGAYLRGAYLQGAANAECACALTVVTCEGSIIGWKKARSPEGADCIVKLRIPEEAKRSNATGRKCRAEYADVIEVFGADRAMSCHDWSVQYIPGQRVYPDSYDENRWNECSNGIHFFITREEAEVWGL